MKEQWLADPTLQGDMADDLTANHLKVGISRDQVEELLGWDIPDDRREFGMDVGPVASQATFGIACCYLDLEFDESGRLTRVYLNPY